jgi:hypothetical protein
MTSGARRTDRLAVTTGGPVGHVFAAAPTTTTGSSGRVLTGSQECARYGSHSQNRKLYASVPMIYARNRTVGAGNDRQIARYWVKAVNATSGATIVDWQYGGQANVNDNQAGAFSAARGPFGSPYWRSFALVGGPTVQLRYFVDWWTSDGRTQLGTAEFTASANVYRWSGAGTNIVAGTFSYC